MPSSSHPNRRGLGQVGIIVIAVVITIVLLGLFTTLLLMSSSSGDRTTPVDQAPTASPAAAPAASDDLRSYRTESAARLQAITLKSETQCMQFVQCVVIRAREMTGDTMRISFQELMENDYLVPGILDSPFDRSNTLSEDFWLHPGPLDRAMILKIPSETPPEASRLIIAYDRVSYATHDHVAVAFLDGETASLPIAEFLELIEQAPNGGVDYQLPPRGM